MIAALGKTEPLILTAVCQNLTSTFDLDARPLTLKQGNSEVKTRFLVLDFDLYNPNLAKVKVNLCTKFQGRGSNGSAVRAQTDIQMDGRYQVHYLPRFAVDKDA